MEQRDLTLKRVRRLLELYQAGYFAGATHEAHPGLEPGSLDNYLYFTLVPALNYQRNSEQLWQAALATWNDPATGFVFNPLMVVGAEEASMTPRVKDALLKHKLALQPDRHAHIWTTLCETLYDLYKNDPRNLLESCGNDVIRVLELLEYNKKRFPYLSGPKLSNYWLYMLSCFTDAELKNRQEISIIPDVHIIRATYKLGLVPTDVVPASLVVRVWKKFLEGTEIAPVDLHGPLWRWSRAGFMPTLDDFGQNLRREVRLKQELEKQEGVANVRIERSTVNPFVSISMTTPFGERTLYNFHEDTIFIDNDKWATSVEQLAKEIAEEALQPPQESRPDDESQSIQLLN